MHSALILEKAKFLVEVSGTPVGSEVWKEYNLPPLPGVTEVNYFTEALIRMKQMAAKCAAAVEHSLSSKANNQGHVGINWEKMYASMSIQAGRLYIRFKIVRVTEDGTRQTAALYAADSRVKDQYGLSDIRGWVYEDLQTPSYGLLFAQQYSGSGDFISYLKADEGKDFSSSIAHAILVDTQVRINTRRCIVGNEEVTSYYIPMVNADCCIYHPTVWNLPPKQTCDACVQADVEIVLAFGDFLVPVVIQRRLGPQGLMAVINEVQAALTGDYEKVRAFFEKCPNRIPAKENRNEERSFVLAAFSLDGADMDIEITPASLCRPLVSNIISIRIIRAIETFSHSPER